MRPTDGFDLWSMPTYQYPLWSLLNSTLLQLISKKTQAQTQVITSKSLHLQDQPQKSNLCFKNSASLAHSIIQFSQIGQLFAYLSQRTFLSAKDALVSKVDDQCSVVSALSVSNSSSMCLYFVC